VGQDVASGPPDADTCTVLSVPVGRVAIVGGGRVSPASHMNTTRTQSGGRTASLAAVAALLVVFSTADWVSRSGLPRPVVDRLCRVVDVLLVGVSRGVADVSAGPAVACGPCCAGVGAGLRAAGGSGVCASPLLIDLPPPPAPASL